MCSGTGSATRDLVARVPDGVGEQQRVRVGEADVLAREADAAARDVERVLAALEHAREPVDRGVGVGVAHRLVQRRDDVVVLLAVLVVHQRLAADALGEDLVGDRPDAVHRPRVRDGRLERAERLAGVAVGVDREPAQDGLRHDERLPAVAALVRERAAQQLHDLLLAEAVEDEDLAAGEQRGVDLEGGVLRRGADEDDAALLDERQEGVLLRLVEAVDLVDEEDGPHAEGARLLGAGHDLLDLLDAARDGAEGDELRLREVCDHVGEGGLADAGRPPEDHRGDLVALDHRAQELPGPDEVLLPDELLERARPHAARERLRRGASGLRGGLRPRALRVQ